MPWAKFNPFYPHGNIPVPLSPGHLANSVEGTWQGLKVFETEGVDLSKQGVNGFGYRTKHPEVLTPYLWSFSNHYTKGKFVADGKFDPNAVSGQCGAAVIFQQMISAKIIEVPV